jgi:hypothetical protein
MEALSAHLSYTSPAVMRTAPGTARVMVGGEGGRAAAETLLVFVERLVEVLLVVPLGSAACVEDTVRRAEAPHTPKVVQVGLPVSGWIQ